MIEKLNRIGNKLMVVICGINTVDGLSDGSYLFAGLSFVLGVAMAVVIVADNGVKKNES